MRMLGSDPLRRQRGGEWPARAASAQKGFTTTKITIPTMSTVGTSLAIRK